MTVHYAVVLISMSVQKDFTTVRQVRNVSIDSIHSAVNQFVNVVLFLVVQTVAAWVGQFCCTSLLFPLDLNECSRNMHKCGKGGSCRNMYGGYTCFCHSGYRILTKGFDTECVGKLTLGQ